MKPEFKTNVSMKVTQRQFDLDLKDKLLELGYKDDRPWNRFNNPKVKSKFCYLNICDSQWFFHSHNCETTSHVIEKYNPELFLALAAMTEGEDWIVGEWLKCKDLSLGVISPLLEVKHLEMCNYWLGYASNEYKGYFKKATKEELIKHFTEEEMNTSTKEEKIFPFKLGEQDAKRIINVSCKDWKPILIDMWATDLFTKGSTEINLDTYNWMRNACTPSQNLLFDEIFGQDEKSYEVGDYVITEGYNDIYDGRVLKIKEIDIFNCIRFTVLDNGYFNSYSVFSLQDIKRRATEDEIEKAKLIPDGTPCLVGGSCEPINSYRLRYSNGKGSFYVHGNKTGSSRPWRIVHVLNDINNLPELK